MAQHRSTGRIRDRRGGGPSRPFVRRYTAADVRLLAEVDAALGQRCGPATRAVLRRQFEVFGDGRFERLAGLSNGHLYNLRQSRTYRRKRTVYQDPTPTRRPQPGGSPAIRPDRFGSDRFERCGTAPPGIRTWTICHAPACDTLVALLPIWVWIGIWIRAIVRHEM